MATQLPSQKFH